MVIGAVNLHLSEIIDKDYPCMYDPACKTSKSVLEMVNFLLRYNKLEGKVL